jgi:magnesium transporter
VRLFVLRTTIFYNRDEIREKGDKTDIDNGYNLWMDVVDPSSEDISFIQKEFGLDVDTLKVVEREAKRPQVRLLENYTFTILLDIKYKTLENLIIKGIYLYCGKGWIISIHSSEVDLLTPIRILFNQKNKTITASNIDALYYSMITEIIHKYELLLTSIEFTITDFEQQSIYAKSSKKMLNSLDLVTRQLIIIRRHLWYTRDVVNFLLHMEKDSEDIKYLQIAYDDINQLIELIESYRDTINSARDLYIANVSLQMNDTMRILTIFNTIFLPLTVVAAIYGINGIELMSIIGLAEGFAIVAMTMMVTIAVTLLFFKKKRWIFNSDDDFNSVVKKER